jgi:hypothetical protein
MSKKVLGIGLAIVGFALMAIPGIGTALGLGVLSIAGASISVAAVIGVGLSLAGSFLMGPGKPRGLATSPTDRLHATLDPNTPRKICMGKDVALATDVRYQSFTGANQKYLEQIICHASHKIQAIKKLWIDQELAWTSAGGVQGRFVGFLTVTTRTEGTSANGIAIDSTWTASCTLTGCAYTHVKCLLVHDDGNGGNDSPFASGLSSRMTFIGDGALVYDPRLDSTVAGGSGSHRADNQATWTWDDNACSNPALQELWYELGWKINGKLAVGKGLPKSRIDLASYAVAANACDETVTKSAANGGGTEPRYRTYPVISEGDDPGAVRDQFCASMNAVLRDAGGQLSLTVLHNDLATPATPSGKTAFDENDVLGEMQWDQTPDLSQSFNIVRGTRIDPSDNALYQPVDYPEVSLTSPDGIDRIDTANYPFVHSNGQVQRLAKQRLQRNQYQGRLSFSGGPAFWALNIGDPFALSHAAFGWTGKLFRCAGQKINRFGAVEIVAIEENAVIYAWANDEAAAVTAAAPTVYAPNNDPLQSGMNSAAKTSVVIDPPADVIIYADSTGTIKSGQLPKDVGITASIGTASVTTAGAWSRTVTSGITCTIGSGTGILNITAMTASEVFIPISFTLNGITRTAKLHVVRQDDPPSNSGGTGGTGGTSASTTNLPTTAGNSVASVVWSDTMTVKAGSGGQIQCNAPISFQRTPGTANGQTGAQGKWQWRIVGGTFADIAAAVSSSGNAQTVVNPGDPTDNLPGALTVGGASGLKTGLTNGTNYEVRFGWWRTDVSGTANDVVRVSGTLTATGS